MDLTKRVNRIIGQLKGIQKMVEKKRDCGDILQQMSAVKKAIDSLSKEVILSNICKIVPKGKVGKIEEMVERAINL